MQVNEKIEVMRKFKRWSQEEMAEKLGYSLSGYTKIERGETDPTLSTLERIAKLFEINLQHLLGFSEANVFDVAEHFANSVFSSSNCTILLSETQCAYELEKSRLLLQERDKEIVYLKQIIELLKKGPNP